VDGAAPASPPPLPLRACVASPLLVNGRNGKEASGAVDFSFHESFLGPLVSWTCGLKFRWAVTQNRFGFSAVFGILLQKKKAAFGMLLKKKKKLSLGSHISSYGILDQARAPDKVMSLAHLLLDTVSLRY